MRRHLLTVLAGGLLATPAGLVAGDQPRIDELPDSSGSVGIVMYITDVGDRTNRVERPVTVLPDGSRRTGLYVQYGESALTIPWASIVKVDVCRTNARSLAATVTSLGGKSNDFTVVQESQVIVGWTKACGTSCQVEIPLKAVKTIDAAREDGRR